MRWLELGIGVSWQYRHMTACNVDIIYEIVGVVLAKGVVHLFKSKLRQLL